MFCYLQQGVHFAIYRKDVIFAHIKIFTEKIFTHNYIKNCMQTIMHPMVKLQLYVTVLIGIVVNGAFSNIAVLNCTVLRPNPKYVMLAYRFQGQIN